MNVADLRSHFLEFFIERDHKHLPSAPLVPNDPTLLFTSAGMVQFKDIFAGRAEPRHPKVTTCQKCFRTTDINNVGRTAYHNTFFEMLGNFSFGDYFKQGAIELWWELLTEQLGIPSDRLTAAVYEEDDEAYAIWQDVIGLPSDRIVRLGKDHNWWGPVGGSGPCGPDSEIHFDAGEEHGCGPDCEGPACECNRFNELGNIVFIQYDQQEDGSLVPLEHGCIDTGMGLERTSSILQGVPTVYDTDVFRPIVEAIESAMPRAYAEADAVHRNAIADHVRAAVFLLAEGVMPGNERQGYVFRRILRRAIRAGERLDLAPGTLASFVEPVIDSLGDVYPEILEVRDLGVRLIGREEETFRRTLRDGERRLDGLLEDVYKAGEMVLPGDLAFELNDTYGFPIEMTEEIAAEHDMTVDRAGFDRALENQRARSRGEIKMQPNSDSEFVPAGKRPTKFFGYGQCDGETVVENILNSGGRIDRLVFPESPFYAEAGGQAADTGRVENLDRPGAATVMNVSKNEKGVYLHSVANVEGSFKVGDRCRLIVNAERRRRVERNHTATHLLHATLRKVLGAHVKQAGSLVNFLELRFDFSHFEKLSNEEIARVEDIVNAAVLADHEVFTSEVPLEEAERRGAIGLFDEEYKGKDVVRVVRVGDVSMELCGGTHVRRTGEIGMIVIVSEESIASGVRRIRAITGDAVLDHLRSLTEDLHRIHNTIGEDPIAKFERLRDELREAQERLDRQEAAEVTDVAGSLIEQAESVGGARLIGARVDRSADQLKSLSDTLEETARPAVILLVGDADGSGIAVCKRSKDLDAVDAGAVIRAVSGHLGGGGGGSKAFGQGGGPQTDKLDEALAAGVQLVREALE